MTKAWADNKETILGYYQVNKYPLNQVMVLMATDHGFHASYVSTLLAVLQRAYRQQFRLWGIKKYNRKERPVSRSGRYSEPSEGTRPSSSSTIAYSPLSQGTPRSVHAHVKRQDGISSLQTMPSPYSEMASSYSAPTPNTGFHNDGSVSNPARQSSAIQAAVGRESPSSFLFLPTSDTGTNMKPAVPWQQSNGARKQQDEPNDYKLPCPCPTALGSSNAWTNSQAHHDPYPPVKGLIRPSLPLGDLPPKYQHSEKQFWDMNHKSRELDGRPRALAASEHVSVTPYETRRYHLISSPPHSQGQPPSPRTAKAMFEQHPVPRTVPLSPVSLPEIIVQPCLQRQDHSSSYHANALPGAMDFMRTYDSAYSAREGLSEVPSAHQEPGPTSMATSTSCHESVYPGYHLV
ncbi:hypothetical protein SPBR_07352 [Sporothrix brasiliensis 5110]|uniref:Clr5 domain-containing protein n=1 Tax=Sporothrix brasiliensis 5110 TaxID=1398154 RepID=A0A0C2IT62_9PEZI|nr:uncharacterized protein SPBR_07352 [Sporothrix brasiliensis 5110]KIH88192.1 hypothetical protein SPBR_07352 [Sporothrix brasiliensis 5110]